MTLKRHSPIPRLTKDERLIVQALRHLAKQHAWDANAYKRGLATYPVAESSFRLHEDLVRLADDITSGRAKIIYQEQFTIVA